MSWFVAAVCSGALSLAVPLVGLFCCGAPRVRRWTEISLGCCALALLSVVGELVSYSAMGDYGTLEDTAGAWLACSLALVAGVASANALLRFVKSREAGSCGA